MSLACAVLHRSIGKWAIRFGKNNSYTENKMLGWVEGVVPGDIQGNKDPGFSYTRNDEGIFFTERI